jgi:uncharacterized membrane protein YjjP (DUF1212 family)
MNLSGQKPFAGDFQIVTPIDQKADPRELFTIRLALALHRFGTPAHRIERMLDRIMERLGMQGEFFALPTSIFASFGRPELHRTSMMRGETGDVNLEKLVLVDHLAERVIRGEGTLAEATIELDRILAGPGRFGRVLHVVGMVVGAAVAGRVLGGGWREVVVAGTIGLCTGVIAPFFSQNRSRRHLFEIVASGLGAAIAIFAAQVVTPLSPFVATLAGLIMLIPGMRLTIAMTEIASGHLVSGSARLTGAALAFLGIAFGTAFGTQIATELFPQTSLTGVPTALPELSLWIMLMLFPVSMMIMMQARPRDLPYLLLSTFLAFGGARIGTQLLGPELGAFLGALVLGVGANVVAQLRELPASLVIAPGLILLVPGSIGYRSISSLMQHDVVNGIELAFSMAIVAFGIVTGLLMANAIVRTGRDL